MYIQQKLHQGLSQHPDVVEIVVHLVPVAVVVVNLVETSSVSESEIRPLPVLP